MSYDKVIHRHYEDISNLSILLRNYIEIYRLLISSVSELNATSITKKSEIKHSQERVESIGKIIDELIDAIKEGESSYIKYCSLKNQILSLNINKKNILSKILDDIDINNKEKMNSEDNHNPSL